MFISCLCENDLHKIVVWFASVYFKLILTNTTRKQKWCLYIKGAAFCNRIDYFLILVLFGCKSIRDWRFIIWFMSIIVGYFLKKGGMIFFKLLRFIRDYMSINSYWFSLANQTYLKVFENCPLSHDSGNWNLVEFLLR